MSNKKLNLLIRSRLVQIVIIFIGIGLIVNLSKDIIGLLKSAGELKLTEQRVEEVKEETLSLKQKKEYYQSNEFIEEMARNKLNMVREGEAVVILPPNIKEVLGYQDSTLPEYISNWKQWLNLFR